MNEYKDIDGNELHVGDTIKLWHSQRGGAIYGKYQFTHQPKKDNIYTITALRDLASEGYLDVDSNVRHVFEYGSSLNEYIQIISCDRVKKITSKLNYKSNILIKG